jgi:FtsZ-binding cell division protein ZapB
MRNPQFIYAVLALAATTAWAQDDREAARLHLEKWLETQRLISREEQEWRIGKELVTERIELLKRESEALKEKIAQTRQETAEAAAKGAELRAQNEALKAGLKPLQQDLKHLELRTLAILPWTPEPVRNRVAPLSQRIPANPLDSKLTLSERYQNVIGTLNELNKAARELAVSGEVRKLADGRQVEATVFYVGLCQAYYVNEKSGVAGIGRLGPLGSWAWEEHNGIAPAIAQVLGIYRSEKPAAYVSLPVEAR